MYVAMPIGIGSGVGGTCEIPLIWNGKTPLLIYKSRGNPGRPSAALVCKFIRLNMCTGPCLMAYLNADKVTRLPDFRFFFLEILPVD